MIKYYLLFTVNIKSDIIVSALVILIIAKVYLYDMIGI